MIPQIGSLLSMLLGNPLTTIPGLIGVCALFGPAVQALGDALVHIGAGDDFWIVVVNFVRTPSVAMLGASIGIIFSKDFNRTGGTRQV